eukprot:CAMPEP_0194301408 /NCGR_PEP_ID=MMETSP0169-20130528/61776_1 /TAXON_ID=218684 /ORGANISM="Corethron pennatum, Strain L29A3" /LENGTH=155 /DNA_ID=CAMNT_0039051647 /DNA_START=3352 /DNA_END=3819 /DNA_ORIENTATION=+
MSSNSSSFACVVLNGYGGTTCSPSPAFDCADRSDPSEDFRFGRGGVPLPAVLDRESSGVLWAALAITLWEEPRFQRPEAAGDPLPPAAKSIFWTGLRNSPPAVSIKSAAARKVLLLAPMEDLLLALLANSAAAVRSDASFLAASTASHSIFAYAE